MEFQPLINAFLTFDYFRLVPAMILLIIGIVCVKLLPKLIVRIFHKRLSHHATVVVQRLITYAFLALLFTLALSQLGIDLKVLMGAAGILTVAIGFASQTSVSNIISGLFLLGERPFALGDVIEVDSNVGEVISVGLLSVKIRTFQNGYLRIPNEVLIKSTVNTLTRFPIRRIDVTVGISYKEDIETVKNLVLEYISQTPDYLKEPEPLFIVNGFKSSSIDLTFGVWGPRDQFLVIKNKLHIDIQKLFRENSIEIPFPQVTLTVDEKSHSLPVSMTTVDKADNTTNA